MITDIPTKAITDLMSQKPHNGNSTVLHQSRSNLIEKGIAKLTGKYRELGVFGKRVELSKGEYGTSFSRGILLFHTVHNYWTLLSQDIYDSRKF